MEELTTEECKEIMRGIWQTEMERRTEVKKLRAELRELGKTGELSDPKRFVEILKELNILNPVDVKYNLTR